MSRTLAAASLLVLAACDFPSVPPQDRSLASFQPAPGPGWGEPAVVPAGPARSASGKLVANAVSSVVVNVDGAYVPLQIGPSTELSIGGVTAGPRELLPGSDVRVTWKPGAENLALRIQAEPGSLGWEGTRAYGTPPR